jgi:hypothetical protein
LTDILSIVVGPVRVNQQAMSGSVFGTLKACDQTMRYDVPLPCPIASPHTI